MIIKSYTWQIFIKCKAGGIFNDTGDESQHLQGSIDEVNLFLATTRGIYSHLYEIPDEFSHRRPF